MELTMAAFLIVFEIVGVVALAVGVPVALGIMLYDLAQTRKRERAEAQHARVKDSLLHIVVERGVARAFVVLGGTFWSIATFAALYSYRESGAVEAVLGAAVPAVACLVTLVLGWFYERLTAALLALGAIGVIAWGIIYQFEAGVWAIMTLALIGPMLTAAALFWLARREQDAYEAATLRSPEIAFIFSARSSLLQNAA